MSTHLAEVFSGISIDPLLTLVKGKTDKATIHCSDATKITIDNLGKLSGTNVCHTFFGHVLRPQWICNG